MGYVELCEVIMCITIPRMSHRTMYLENGLSKLFDVNYNSEL